MDRRPNVLVQTSERLVGRALRTDRWTYGVVAPGPDGSKVSAGDVYVEDVLYELERDPAERHNSAVDPGLRAVADGLAATLGIGLSRPARRRRGSSRP